MGGRPNYEPYGRDRISDPPELDCITDHCILIHNTEAGAFVTNDGLIPRAKWCLWCGSAVTNEYVPED